MLVTVPERARCIATSLARRHKKLLAQPEWTDEELEEVSPTIRRGILEAA